MKTTPRTVINDVTADEVLAAVRAFEAAHPGTNRSNYVAVFRAADGELDESDEFFEVCCMYSDLDALERSR
jgi:ketosteroid isomerase-like protein